MSTNVRENTNISERDSVNNERLGGEAYNNGATDEIAPARQQEASNQTETNEQPAGNQVAPAEQQPAPAEQQPQNKPSTQETNAPKEQEKQDLSLNPGATIKADEVRDANTKASGLTPSSKTEDESSSKASAVEEEIQALQKHQTSSNEAVGFADDNVVAAPNMSIPATWANENFRKFASGEKVNEDNQNEEDNLNEEVEESIDPDKAKAELQEKMNSGNLFEEPEEAEKKEDGPTGDAPADGRGFWSKLWSRVRAKNEQKKIEKNKVKKKVGKKEFNAQAFYGKVTAHASVALDEILVGEKLVEEALAIPESEFSHFMRAQGLELSDNLKEAVQQAKEFCNSHDVVVGCFKSPNLNEAGICQMVLKIGRGSAMEMHPMAFKKFNADTDGDELCITFRQEIIDKLSLASVDYFIDLAHDLLLDPDFMSFYIAPGGIVIENQKNKTLDYILASITKKKSLAKKIEAMYFSPEGDLREEAIEDYLTAVYKTFAGKNGRVYDTRGFSKFITKTEKKLHDLKISQFALDREKQWVELLEDAPAPQTADDKKIVDFVKNGICESFVKGTPPANFQDLRVMLCDYLGEQPGTNPSFRITASIGKYFGNLDDRATVGTETEVSLTELSESLFRFLASKKMSQQLDNATLWHEQQEIIRKRTIRDVGMLPNGTKEKCVEFLNRFIAVYKENATLLNASPTETTTSHTFTTTEKKIQFENFGDLARALDAVYGDSITMAELFWEDVFKQESNPNSKYGERDVWGVVDLHIRQLYGSWSIHHFAKDNKVDISLKRMEPAVETPIEKFSLDNRNLELNLKSLVYALASKRSSTASDFNKKVYGDSGYSEGRNDEETKAKAEWYWKNSVCYKCANIIKEIAKTPKDHRDLNDLLNLVNMSNPDLFAYYGMDNIDGFLESSFGKAMMETEDLEQFKSIRIAMVAQWRTHKIVNLMNKLALETEDTTKLWEQIAYEKAKLASSSWAWEAIVADSTQHAQGDISRPFYRLCTEPANNLIVTQNVKKPEWSTKIIPNYKHWDKVGKTHLTLLSVLADVDIPKEDKCDMVSDVVRLMKQVPNYASYQVSCDLEMDPDPVYSMAPPAREAVMEATNEFNSAYDKIMQRGDSLAQHFEEMYANHRSHKGRLTKTLDYLADNPDYMYQWDSDIAADAMCAVLDKTFPQTEKGKQHPWTNTLYSCLNQVLNGGFHSDVYRTDDRALGLTQAQSLTPHDIVSVLAGKKRFFVYGEDGQIVLLNQSTLIRGYYDDTPVEEDEIWAFLSTHFEIAALIRTYKACPTGDLKGGAYLGTLTDGNETIYNICQVATEKRQPEQDIPKKTQQRKMLTKLIDDPSFAALVAIRTPTKGKVGREVRDYYRNNIFATMDVLIDIAATANKMGRLPSSVLETFGVTKAKLVSIGLVEDVADDITKDINEFVKRVMAKYQDELANTEKYGIGGQYGLDLSSCSAYYDVRQEFSGSKTNTSTGVEGSESQKSAVFLASLGTKLKDRFGNFKDLGFNNLGKRSKEQLIAEFGECMTSQGKTIAEFTDEDWKAAKQEIAVMLPEGYAHFDKSLNGKKDMQCPTVFSYFLIKRDKGAEQFNLKAKKTGDDGLHSIIKYGRWFTDEELAQLFEVSGTARSNDYGDIISSLNADYDGSPQSLFNAKVKLAKRLLLANHMIKYTDMDLSDCMNIADMMIGDSTNGMIGAPVITLYSLSSIAKAIKAALTFEDIRKLKKSEIENIAMSAVDELKNQPITTNVQSILNYVKPRPKATTSNKLLRPRSSWLTLTSDALSTISQRNPGMPYATRLDPSQAYEPATTEQIKILKKVGLPVGGEYFLAGFDEVEPTCIGPAAVWFFSKEPTEDQVQRIKDLGVTGVFAGNVFKTKTKGVVKFNKGEFVDQVMTKEGEIKDVLIKTKGGLMIPGFEGAIEGWSSDESASFGVIRRPSDNISYFYEDPLNEYSLSDAGIQLFKAYTDRLHIRWADTTNVPVTNIFSSVFQQNPDGNFRISLASQEDIKMILDDKQNKFIDYGVIANPGDIEYERHKALVDSAINRYRENLPTKMKPGGIVDEAKPRDIIGWMTCIVDTPGKGQQKYYAPIMPFDLKKRNGVSREEVPSKFKITKINYTNERVPMQSFVSFDWEYSDSLENHTIKLFEGQNFANKFCFAMNRAVQGHKFKNGVDIDGCFAEATTASRRVGSNKRLGTLQTLVLMARTQGYNFATDYRSSDNLDESDSFPDNPVFTNDDGEEELIKERLAAGYMSNSEWASIGLTARCKVTDIKCRFVEEPELDHWIKQELITYVTNGGNATDYLCCSFDGRRTDIWWEPECMLQTSLAYQDNLMKFYHGMDHSFCGESHEDHGEQYLFRCDGSSDGFQRHCMQMQVPVYSPIDGKYFNNWVNVYGSWTIFNMRDFTGAHALNVNGYSDTMDAIIASASSGRNVGDRRFRLMLEQAMSDVGSGIGSFVDILHTGGITPKNPAEYTQGANEPQDKQQQQKQQKQPARGGDESQPPQQQARPTRELGEEWGKTCAIIGDKVSDDAISFMQNFLDANEIDTMITGLSDGENYLSQKILAEDNSRKLVLSVGEEGLYSFSEEQKEQRVPIIEASSKLMTLKPGKTPESFAHKWSIDNADIVCLIHKGDSEYFKALAEYALKTNKEVRFVEQNKTITPKQEIARSVESLANPTNIAPNREEEPLADLIPLYSGKDIPTGEYQLEIPKEVIDEYKKLKEACGNNRSWGRKKKKVMKDLYWDYVKQHFTFAKQLLCSGESEIRCASRVLDEPAGYWGYARTGNGHNYFGAIAEEVREELYEFYKEDVMSLMKNVNDKPIPVKPDGSKTKIYAGVGSRETDKATLSYMKDMAGRLEANGFKLLSGGADGADKAFESGTKNSQVFLAEDIASNRFGNAQQALTIAEQYYHTPRKWSGLSPRVKQLMARNCYEVLGEDLNSPVDFVLCKSKLWNGKPSGGTSQAIRIAEAYGIPVFNLAYDGERQKFEQWVMVNYDLKPRQPEQTEAKPASIGSFASRRDNGTTEPLSANEVKETKQQSQPKQTEQPKQAKQTTEQLRKKLFDKIKKDTGPVTEFRGDYSFLSNMFLVNPKMYVPTTFYLIEPEKGVQWLDLYEGRDRIGVSSSEALFQAIKATYTLDIKKDSYMARPYQCKPFEHILTLSPKEAKREGRKLDIDIELWNKYRLDAMELALEAKFKDTNLRALLMATGNRELIEGNTWGDTFWGVDKNTGQGENHLGRILMELRDKYNRPTELL